MSNDPEYSPFRSTRPTDHVGRLSFSVEEKADQLLDLYSDVGDVGCSPPDNLRVTFRVPYSSEVRSSWPKRSGWVVYSCELSGHRFAAPKGAPIPMLAFEKQIVGTDETFTQTKRVHPDLLYDQSKLIEWLVEGVEVEVKDHLAAALDMLQLLQALGEMETLPNPDGGAYPKTEGRKGYAAVGDRRPGRPESH